VTLVLPPRWSSEQLDLDRQAAITEFRRVRVEEPLEDYHEAFDEYRGAVEDLLETTVDLQQLAELAEHVLRDPALQLAVRYLAGPPISKDDLMIVAEAESLAPGRIKQDPDMAKRIIDTVLLALDRRRFPWVAEDREPEPAEREAATLASAALMASRRVLTSRANLGKTEQEQAVEDALIGAGFEKVAARDISTLDKAPGDGEFCRESKFGDRKADLVIGLWDGRNMPIEAKVSNSSTNSIKRLNNDAVVKAKHWIGEFGTRSVVPTAVLSGVFKLSHLERAQNDELTLFWAHSLAALTDWIEQTKPGSLPG
jgi:hypothetical protein